mgnify:FL=1
MNVNSAGEIESKLQVNFRVNIYEQMGFPD